VDDEKTVFFVDFNSVELSILPLKVYFITKGSRSPEPGKSNKKKITSSHLCWWELPCSAWETGLYIFLLFTTTAAKQRSDFHIKGEYLFWIKKTLQYNVVSTEGCLFCRYYCQKITVDHLHILSDKSTK